MSNLQADTALKRRMESISGVFGKARLHLAEWVERSRARRALERLDDHLLKDIGLSRHEVRREAAKPFWKA